ncbi:hypothetical protein [Companilactobacillus bobalius]|uniref:Uncharacterized protein n=2 Tax=Companilactobacillus bobalius TaxID=2801451 RepID=A0A202F433_9LACO|nr:hypothetical protein [Companilactobacillus bobalius]KAE9560107.1 hypothetical protein ATN92_07715 [Companilactobacillus bobalius]KRK84920.1 hypothetical protein FC78_GL001159 [Companilactobacillus bobalius DSM 19674]OVE95261.1 hypothetical protein LKACC16343_02645 [Companilactobacillus bobalius]GEO58684.1 hypothetical protein LBO01_18130 [Companilactobacillus paralimentarius]
MNKTTMRSQIDFLGSIAVRSAKTPKEWHEAIQLSIQLAEELDVMDKKPKMPQFFKLWTDKNYGDICAQLYLLAKVAFSGALSDDNEATLREWINRDPWRYQICVDAIVNGFEVESNE